jgi:hypothetical protein
MWDISLAPVTHRSAVWPSRPHLFAGGNARRPRSRLIHYLFRARPIAPGGSNDVSARTTHAPQLRIGGGIPMDTKPNVRLDSPIRDRL